VTTTDDLLDNARSYAAAFDLGRLEARPARRIAVVTCMDARLNPSRLLGLKEGDGHVIRNAGGVVTEDVIRSLTISQRLLGTEEIVVIHHTGCGMLTFSGAELHQAIEAETGIRPSWAVETFRELDAEVRQSMARIDASPFIVSKANVRGFVYDIADGTLREVSANP
jgi:carbonic anhydrase